MTSKLDVAEFRTRNLCCSMCLQKSQASADVGVAESFVCIQSSKKDLNAQMTGAVTDVTLSQLSLSTHQKSKFSGTKSQRQLPTKPWLLLISWSMDKIPAVHLFFIHGTIGLEIESLMCKVLSRQRVLMKQLLGHRTRVTRVTLRSSPRQDDQNLNLVNSCVGPAETALVSSTCTATAQSFQQGDLVACEASIY